MDNGEDAAGLPWWARRVQRASIAGSIERTERRRQPGFREVEEREGTGSVERRPRLFCQARD